MKIKIKHINKKIIAGLMAGTMILSTSGCGKYSVTSTEGYYLSGSYSFSELETVQVYIINEDIGAVVTVLRNAHSEYGYFHGYEILTDAYYESSQSVIVKSFGLQDYLLSKNLIKDSYRKNDFEEIYSMLRDEYIINGKINKNNINFNK